MSRMKERQIDEDGLVNEVPTSSPLHVPEPKLERDQIDPFFEDEAWEHHAADAGDIFRDGCGPDFESTQDTFSDRPVVLLREQIRYADSGEVVRTRIARLNLSQIQRPLPLHAFLPSKKRSRTETTKAMVVVKKKRTCHVL